MTTVTIVWEDGQVAQLNSMGHAGTLPAGENIVCAAVSVLMFTCVNALSSVAGVTPITTIDERRAAFTVRLPKLEPQAMHDAQIILRTTVQGLTDISHEYPRLVQLNILNGRNTP